MTGIAPVVTDHLMVMNLKVVQMVSLHVLMAVAYLDLTTVMVPLKTAMPDGDLTVQTALMKY